MHRKRNVLIVLLIACALIAGCATIGAGTAPAAKPFAQMSYVERATYFQDIYNKQYDDTAAMGAMPNLTPAQTKIYNMKKEVLTKAWPLIRVYRTIVVNGGVPDPGKEQEINNLINQLLAAGL